MSMMTDMMESVPDDMMMPGMDMAMMTECIEACSACSMAATMCADASIMDGMGRCSSLCASMADMPMTMMRVMMRPAGYDMAVMRPMMMACIEMGKACAMECRMHMDMVDCCRICADACDAMVMACEKMMAKMGMPA